MRSMSMLQLLGGVAAAGVVAAGATAFTASGVTADPGITAADKFLGGGVSVTATGTVVDSITYGYNDPGTNTQLDTVVLHFADTNAGAGHVTLVTAGSGAAQPTWTCEDIGDTNASESSCTASAPYTLSAANIVSTMTVSVFAA